MISQAVTINQDITTSVFLWKMPSLTTTGWWAPSDTESIDKTINQLANNDNFISYIEKTDQELLKNTLKYKDLASTNG